MSRKKQMIVKTYKGSHSQAMAAFQKDVPRLAEQGYQPMSQTWAEGSYGCGSFLIALLLCFLIIGFLIFVYMLIVKPPGTLSVTYEITASESISPQIIADGKTCPKCAERIKNAAVVCRYCGHSFE